MNGENKTKKSNLPKVNPEIIDLGPMTYITIRGKGNPNNPLFSELVTALYATSYAIKMMPKKGITPEGYYDYTVFPLEGFWSLEPGSLVFDKDKLTYKIMLRQPDFITPELFEIAKEKATKKNFQRIPLSTEA
ncbi:GyrI-like domain-containing protein [Listeria cornellensis]|uniref:Uncharacterized protein n=1 Tax=Listeria cornellensis FSL F6-0969 TaxID=1265820 RepID=W7BF51_9LIST|nr:GyrI-like domain-containing protein [Listeria cornellensis]EUJ25764.1 hypothetical protein PCORN_16120 [Listeria cornellensis FSL F6-0969]